MTKLSPEVSTLATRVDCTRWWTYVLTGFNNWSSDAALQREEAIWRACRHYPAHVWTEQTAHKIWRIPTSLPTPGEVMRVFDAIVAEMDAEIERLAAQARQSADRALSGADFTGRWTTLLNMAGRNWRAFEPVRPSREEFYAAMHGSDSSAAEMWFKLVFGWIERGGAERRPPTLAKFVEAMNDLRLSNAAAQWVQRYEQAFTSPDKVRYPPPFEEFLEVHRTRAGS